MTRSPARGANPSSTPPPARRGRQDAHPTTSSEVATAARTEGEDLSWPTRAELRFRALAEATSQIVWIVSPDGIHDRDTATWQAFTGLGAADVAGWNWLNAIHPDDRPRTQADWADAVATGATFETEYRLRRADGAYRHMWVRGVPVRDPAGNVLEWVGTCIDVTERLALEAETRERRQELEAIVHTMTDGVFLYDAAGHVAHLNGAARALLAIPPGSDYLSLPLDTRREILAPRDASGQPLHEPPQPVTRILRGETLSGRTGLDLTLRRLDGEILRCNLAGAPIRDATGQITGAVVVLRDINERYRMEAVLAERQRQLDAILSAITDRVYFYDAAGHLLYANPAAHAHDARLAETGYIAVPVLERLSDRDIRDEQGNPIAPDQTALARVLRGEVLTAARAVDTWMRAPDGVDILLSTTGSPVVRERREPLPERVDPADVLGAVIVCRDITSRYDLEHRTHVALETLLGMARTLIEEPPPRPRDAGASLPPALASAEATAQHLVDLGRRMLGCAQASLTVTDALTGRPRPLAVAGLPLEQAPDWRESVRHVRPEDYLAADDLRRMRAGELVITTYKASTLLLVPLVLRGTYLGVLTLGYTLREQPLTPEDIALARGVADLCALVLERHRLLREQAAAEARALASEETKRQMDALFALASHELRTPITVVKTTAEVAKRRLDKLDAALTAHQNDAPTANTRERFDQERREVEAALHLIERNIKAADRQDRLVSDLLDVSRLQLGHFDLRHEPFDLADLVRETVGDLRLAHPQSALRLDLSAASLRVDADSARVGQVLTNYITNALKYAPVGSPVTVGLERRGNVARVRVRDSGPGIAPEEQPHIWDQFYQVPHAAWSGGSQVGLGLGLYLSREIVTRLGGQVGVESAPGQGSIFWFTLPLAGIQL